MLIIAYDRNSTPISIVIAKSEDAASAYWQGKELPVHSTRIIESLEPVEHTIVNPILNTNSRKLGTAFDTKRETIVEVVRG